MSRLTPVAPAAASAAPSVPAKTPWGYYLAALGLAGMGIIFLNDYRYALAAQKRWAPSSGRIIENHVVTHRGRKSTSYNTFISYTYSTETTVYSAGPIEINKYKPYMTGGGAQADLDKYFPQGKIIDVYYNPENPYESSLGLAGAPGLQVPLAFFLLAFGAIYFAREIQG